MGRLITGIFTLIMGLIAFYVVSAFAEAVETTGLTANWSETETLLILRILPAVLIFGVIVSVFLGIKRRISGGDSSGDSPEDFPEE